jgi:hypothetical protein
MGHSLEQARETPGGIPYAVLLTEYECISFGRQTATVDYRVYAEDAQDFVRELMPGPIQDQDLVRQPPYLSLGVPNHLKAEKASVKALSDDKPIDPFSLDQARSAVSEETYGTYARVSVSYGTNLNSFYQSDRSSDHPEDILEPTFNLSVDTLAVLVNKGMFFARSGQPEDASPIKALSAPIAYHIPNNELSFKWPWALNPDFDKIIALVGTLNRNGVIFLDDAPTETVMFLGISGKQEYHHFEADAAIRPWVLEYKFARRHLIDGDVVCGWNHFYNPERQQFETLFRQTGDHALEPLYSTGDFLDLFKAAPAP